MSTHRLDEARWLQRTGRTAEAIAAFEAAERSALSPLEKAEILPFLCGAEPWLPAESEVIGRHIDYLRGRAWMGLGPSVHRPG